MNIPEATNVLTLLIRTENSELSAKGISASISTPFHFGYSTCACQLFSSTLPMKHIGHKPSMPSMTDESFLADPSTSLVKVLIC